MFSIGSAPGAQEARARQSIWQRKFHATRTSAHLVFAIVLWPLVTVGGTTAAILLLPYYSVSFQEAFLAAALGTAMIATDMVMVGAIVFGLSAFVFSRLGQETRDKQLGCLRLGIEPFVTCTAIVAGSSLWYPAMVSAPLLAPMGRLPAVGVIVVLMGITAASAAHAAKPGSRVRLVLVMILGGALAPVPGRANAELARWTGHRPDAVVLGVDSVSLVDDVQPLEQWTRSRGGAWYEHAVTPGLLTNAVWSSILAMKTVRAHGVFLTFQRLAASDASLLDAARANGYRTVSAFSNQLTSMVGSRAGFDVDRSGPVGWRQLLLPLVADNSLLLPVFKPALPRLPFMALASNQAGSYTYDVRREVREILRSGSSGGRTLVMAHLTYPHLPAYPSSVDLTWEELWRVARAPAATVFDRSFDWQDADSETDPVPLQDWKIAQVQRVISSEVDSSGYIAQGGKMIVFSDHGNRAGLTVKNFGDKRYHHVVLATFGVPARCTRSPISLVDIGSLLQLADKTAEPSVEYMFTPETLVPILVRHARLRWSGDVDIDDELLKRLFKALLRYDPAPESGHGACRQTDHHP